MIGKIGVVAGKIAWLAGWRFDSVEKMKKINAEKLFMYAKNDKVIDYQKAAVYKKEKVD